jgi:hypothetical protein
MTRFTTWPLMSRPRMACAASKASSGFLATLTPPAPDLHLGLDDDDAAELLGRSAHLFRRVRNDAREHRYLVVLEQVSGLVLVKIHA